MATLTQSVRTIRTSSPGYYTYRCIVTENSYSVANNTSNVTITFAIAGPSGWGLTFSQHTTHAGILVDGSVKASNSTSPDVYGGSYVNLITWTGDVAHNSDGAKSINVGIYLYHNSTAYGYLPTPYNQSSPLSMGSVSLTTIPRASSFGSISGNTIGSSMTVNINRNSSSFTHTVRYKLGNSGWYTAATGAGTSATFTLSNELLGQLPSSTSGTLQINIQTYNGNTAIGSEFSKTVTVYVASSVKPTVGTITLNPHDINGHNILVQGKNQITVGVSNSSAGTGSTIKSFSFSGPGISYTGASTSTSGGPISSSGTLTYSVTVTDNRGRTASKTATITCHAYQAPRFTSFNAYRSNSSGTATDSGTYIKCNFGLAFSTVNNTNDVTVAVKYRKGSSGSWQSSTVLTDSKNTSGNKLLSSIDDASTYDIYAEVTDNYSGKTSSTHITVFGATRALNISSDGTGFAIGKMSEHKSQFECKWPAKLYSNCQVDGNLTIGTSTTISTPTNGIYIHDVRDASITPNSFGDKNANFYFDHIDGRWRSAIHLKGWPNTDGNYAAWELAGNADKDNNDTTLKYRSGTGDTWSEWYTIARNPVTLYNNSDGNAGTVALSYSSANYAYLEIFFMDNTSNGHSSVKVYSPNGKKIDLSIVEASDATALRTYIRRSLYTISGSTITPSPDVSGFVLIDGNSVSHTTSVNYLRITRVVGYP